MSDMPSAFPSFAPLSEAPSYVGLVSPTPQAEPETTGPPSTISTINPATLNHNGFDIGWVEDFSPDGRWVCHSPSRSRPTMADIQNRTSDVPICLRIIQDPYVHRESLLTPSLPEAPLCLMGSDNLDEPPVYCNNNNQAIIPPLYLWWSPCSKCGTAWRIFGEMDNEQSWYKLPADRPGNDQTPVYADPSGWLGWDGSGWLNTNLIIQECENPEMECIIDQPYEETLFPSNDASALWSDPNYQGDYYTGDPNYQGDYYTGDIIYSGSDGYDGYNDYSNRDNSNGVSTGLIIGIFVGCTALMCAIAVNIDKERAERRTRGHHAFRHNPGFAATGGGDVPVVMAEGLAATGGSGIPVAMAVAVVAGDCEGGGRGGGC